MTIKTLDEIWQDYLNHDNLPAQTLKDLTSHIQTDAEPERAIVMATDMHLKTLAPFIAQHLDNEDDFVREIAVGSLIGRLHMHEYAEEAFQLAKEDPYSNVRSLAVSSLGAIIDKVDKKLQCEIAQHIYDVMTSSDYDALHKQSAYHSVIEAMEIPLEKWPCVQRNPNIKELVDTELLEKFKKKYKL